MGRCVNQGSLTPKWSSYNKSRRGNEPWSLDIRVDGGQRGGRDGGSKAACGSGMLLEGYLLVSTFRLSISKVYSPSINNGPYKEQYL